jgi:hypothetical protein
MTFRERLASVSVNKAGWETADKRNYYDRSSVEEIFGSDAREQMMEETKGIGAVKLGRDGALYKRGEDGPKRLTDRETSFILNGDEAEDVV